MRNNWQNILLGQEKALFPVGRSMASQLTNPEFLQSVRFSVGELQWTDYYWVYIFAFAVGAGTTIAEPALIAVAMKANEVSGGAIGVFGLRAAVAIGVAVGLALGTYRIVVGVPMHYFIITGYVIVVVQTFFSPKLIVPLAYDSGGVTTSTVTVPLVAALGLGLAETVPGRSPLIDGFGLIAFASLCPIISVMAYAQLSELKNKRAHNKQLKADEYYILTDVPYVFLNYGKENQKEIEFLNVSDTRKHLEEGMFGEGNMAPKIRACLDFIENGGKKSVITEAFKLEDKSYGTKITMEYED